MPAPGDCRRSRDRARTCRRRCVGVCTRATAADLERVASEVEELRSRHDALRARSCYCDLVELRDRKKSVEAKNDAVTAELEELADVEREMTRQDIERLRKANVPGMAAAVSLPPLTSDQALEFPRRKATIVR